MKQLGFLIALSIILIPGQISAQSFDSLAAGTTINLVPQVPGPNQEVRATLESSAVNLDTASINWLVNGTSRLSGRGEKVLTFTTTGLGSRMTISAIVDSNLGRVTSTRNIEISSVDLLWHGTGYTPPFYKGKTLWGRQTGINFLAIANSSNSSNLIYKWSLDGEVVGSSSGVGKNSFSIGDSILGLPRTVSVELVLPNGTVTATNSITLTPISGQLMVYELHPLYGFLFNNEANSTYHMREEEVTFAAFPMFFSNSRTSSSINYSWRTSAGVDVGNQVTYRIDPSSKVASWVDVRANDVEKFIQSASKMFELRFDPDNR